MNRCNARLWTHQHELGVAGSSIDDDRDLEAQSSVDSTDISAVDRVTDSAVNSCRGKANGGGVPENDKTAVMRYTKAAEQGDARAQTHLGLMYDIGDGVLENDTTAVMWYTKAAELGEGRAQYNLGLKYANGEGVPENDVKAYVWYALAKANGFFWAKNNLELLKQEMTKPQIAKAQELAAKRHASGLKACD